MNRADGYFPVGSLFSFGCVLLHGEYAHIRNPLQLAFQTVDVGLLLDLAVVVGVEYAGTYGLHGAHGLIDGHRVWLVHG